MKTAYSLAALAMIFPFVLAQSQEPKRQKGASVPPAVIPHKFEAKVVSVLDGDTIRVANAEISVATVRLEGIDAPESAQEFGKEATQYLHHLLLRKQVTVEWKERDKYDRLLGYVYFENNLINKSLVDQGYAWQFTKYNKSDALKQIEASARSQKRGLWGREAPIAPWDWRDGVRPPKPEPDPEKPLAAVAPLPPAPTASAPPVSPKPTPKEEETTVYLTKTGTHYHRAGCQHLKKSAIPIPLSRASGYTPCQHCNPPR